MSDEGGRVVLTKEDIESDDDGDNVPKEERLDSEGSDSELPYVKDDEELDDPSLQFMNMTVEDKVEMATKEKEAGNVLFREKEYEKAWKQYDKAFVNVFVGKEEWAELSEDQKSFLNAFKAPCHLNRGFCRLKLGQYGDALWDFSEAVRIDPLNVKGHYRRALAKIGLIREQMKKEELGKYWDVEKEEEAAASAKEDLMFALKKNPNDVAIRNSLTELKAIVEELKVTKKKYQAAQSQLFSGFLTKMNNGEDSNLTEEPVDYSLMPPLEKVYIGNV